MLNALTVDVEEYFHATEVQNSIGEKSRSLLPSRIEFQLHKTLDLLESKNVSATFLVLGWVAEHYPKLVREIVQAGHEIGCHSYAHRLVYDLSPAEFRADTLRAVQAIEDACGVTSRIYRAPSYSITRKSMWALEVLSECGFKYDSSIFPIAHDRYGIPGFDRRPHLITTPSGPILEVPVATVALARSNVLPIGGGGYLRLLPYRYFSAGIRRANHGEHLPVCIYFHPWELDPDQERLPMGLISRLRTYSGLAGMQKKIERLIDEFSFSHMSAVYPYPWEDTRPELVDRQTGMAHSAATPGE
jgi:polysaccharide deacetylase family protein (PEP-CTERM system associated)